MPGAALSLEEREEIRAGLARGESCAAIARSLRRDPSTVSREVRRNRGRRHYAAVAAQRRAGRHRQRPKVPKLVADPQMAKAVTADLESGFSPAAIAQRLRRGEGGRVCHETIYLALYSTTFRGIGLRSHHCLRSRRRRRRHRGVRTPLALRPHPLGDFKLIGQRPAVVSERSEPGHWEGDLIVGAFNRSAVITLVERVTRFTLLGHLPTTHDADNVCASLARLFADVPETMRRTLTWDQGKEMARWQQLERSLGLDVYFCEPRSPWQRPSNEHTNRQLRYWLPKRTDLRHHSAADLQRIARIVNDHPRRLLSWDTPAQRYAAAAVH